MKKTIAMLLSLFLVTGNSILAMPSELDPNYTMINYQFEIDAKKPDSYKQDFRKFSAYNYTTKPKKRISMLPQLLLINFSTKHELFKDLVKKYGDMHYANLVSGGYYLYLDDKEDPAYKIKDANQLAKEYKKILPAAPKDNSVNLRFLITEKDVNAGLTRLKALKINHKAGLEGFNYPKYQFVIELGKEKNLGTNQKKVIQEILKDAYEESKVSRGQSDTTILDPPTFNFSSELNGAALKSTLQTIEKEIDLMVKGVSKTASVGIAQERKGYLGLTLGGKVTKEQIKEMHAYIQNKILYGHFGVKSGAMSEKDFIDAIQKK